MKPHRIELGDFHEGWAGQWVNVKPWMSFAASAKIDASRFDRSVVGKADDFADDNDVAVNVKVNTVEYSAILIDLQVLDWNVLGYDGEPLPAGRAGVLSDLAPVDVIDVVVAQMSDYYEAQRPNLKPASRS